ncbi:MULTISPECIES: hypothetical protein [Achromobacter]|jgi:hypothetical protein|uniref:Uncharacterized protein n=1 Tax=Achromobacter marplatensis TaxID=470868 RepID=A0AA42W937_9BURK|nr:MULTISPECIES: hypothetical protein [Achromobacter]MDH2050905.1 hypothetical protein [Achromobacter marplatensis]NMK46649.1 hypothetical protein [Achromobacter sp. Bel]
MGKFLYAIYALVVVMAATGASSPGVRMAGGSGSSSSSSWGSSSSGSSGWSSGGSHK